MERAIVNRLQDLGIAAERIPLSGASPFSTKFSGYDLTVPMLDRDVRVECKHMANGFQTLYKWLERDTVDMLMIRADRSETLAVVPLPLLIELIKAAAK